MSDIETFLNIAGKFATSAKLATTDSYTEITKPLTVEPITIVQSALVNRPYMPDVMQSFSSIFAAYYLRAVSMLVNISDINVISLFDSLNPNRSRGWSAAAGANALAAEGICRHGLGSEYDMRLPGIGESDQSPVLEGIYSFDDENKEGERSAQFGKDGAKILGENSNLAVGKNLEVIIERNGSKGAFTVNVRLIPIGMGTGLASNFLNIGGNGTSIRERILMLNRPGGTKLIRDLILCQDLIDQHVLNITADGSEIYEKVLAARRNNNLSAVLSGRPSVASASNIMIVNTEVTDSFRRSTGGDLSKPRVRERVFKDTYMMLLGVIDEYAETLTIYHRSNPHPTELMLREVKNAKAGGQGTDVLDMLKAYNSGNAIRL